MSLLTKTSSRILLGFIVSFIIADATQRAFVNVSDLLAALHTFAISFLLFWWVREHASEHNKTPPWGAKFLSGLVSFIGIPYYLYRTYGFKQGSVKLLLGLLAWFTMVTIYTFISSLALTI